MLKFKKFYSKYKIYYFLKSIKCKQNKLKKISTKKQKIRINNI